MYVQSSCRPPRPRTDLTRTVLRAPVQTLGEELGRGSSARVFKALNSETGEFVAVKQISSSGMTKEQMTALASEVELMKLLKHPNIVNYLESITTKEYLYIVLEYVENGSLASILKRFGSFSEQLVSIYIAQVLDGLAYLHEQGVIHRDIKGANILITKEGMVKLADFGVATRVADDSDRTNSVVGTPYWMAPEIIKMSGFTTASDIWSLGCTLIELLNGEPPYFDLAPMSALFRIVQDEHPPLPADISPGMRDFCLKCFEKAPELRPTAVQMTAHDWITSTKARIANYHATNQRAADAASRSSAGEVVERPDVIVSDAVRMLHQGQAEEARERFERAQDSTIQLRTLSPTSAAVAMSASHVTVRGERAPMDTELLRRSGSPPGASRDGGAGAEGGGAGPAGPGARNSANGAGGAGGEASLLGAAGPVGNGGHGTGAGPMHLPLALELSQGQRSSESVGGALRPAATGTNGCAGAAGGGGCGCGPGGGPCGLSSQLSTDSSLRADSLQRHRTADFGAAALADMSPADRAAAMISASRAPLSPQSQLRGERGAAQAHLLGSVGLGLGDSRVDEVARRLEPFMERPADDDYSALLAAPHYSEADGAGLGDGGLRRPRGPRPPSLAGGRASVGSSAAASSLPLNLSARLAARLARTWHEEWDGGLTDYFASVAPPSDRETHLAAHEREVEARRADVRALIASLAADPLRQDMGPAVRQCKARLERRPQLASDFAHEHGLIPVVELLQQAARLPLTQQANLLDPLLALANELASSGARFVCENLCLLGAVPAVAFFAGLGGLPAAVHLQVALFLNTMCRAGPATLAMLVSSGALPDLAGLLEPEIPQRREQTKLAVDSVWCLFQMRSWKAPRSDFCRLLATEGVLVKLARALHMRSRPGGGGVGVGARSERVSGEGRAAEGLDGRYSDTVSQAADVLLLFSHADETAARGMLQHGVLQDVLLVVQEGARFHPQTLLTVLKCVKNLSMGPSGHVVALQKAGAVRTLVYFLDSISHDAPYALEMRGQVLLSLYHLCKVNRLQQEQAVVCPPSKGIVPHLQDAVVRSTQLKHVALPMLCDIARASKRSRTELWKHSGEPAPSPMPLAAPPFPLPSVRPAAAPAAASTQRGSARTPSARCASEARAAERPFPRCAALRLAAQARVFTSSCSRRRRGGMTRSRLSPRGSPTSRARWGARSFAAAATAAANAPGLSSALARPPAAHALLLRAPHEPRFCCGHLRPR